MMPKTILKIDSSGRNEGSLTRNLTEKITQTINKDSKIIYRDLISGIPFVNENWIHANFTASDQRTESQKAALIDSDKLIHEIMQADTIVIGAPIYNFSIPAVLKAWIDMIARAGVTFKYSEGGPEGLLKNKKAIIATASGGVPIGSEYDFATNYLKHAMSFIGINDTTIIDANNYDDQFSDLT